MLHNRYYEEYESDFQYYLRREMSSTTVKYIPVYITPTGEWFYDEPNTEEYITVHVDSRSTQSNIDTIAWSYMDQFKYPF